MYIAYWIEISVEITISRLPQTVLLSFIHAGFKEEF